MVDFARLQLEVEAIMLARADIGAAEDVINEVPGFTSDQRAALWLYAWSLLPPQRQRQEALAHIELVRRPELFDTNNN